MTTYELWQQEKYGNYIPESDTDDSHDEDFNSIRQGEQPSVENNQLGIDYKNFQSLSNL